MEKPAIEHNNLIYKEEREKVSLYESKQNTFFKINGVVLSESGTKCNISKTILAKESGDNVIVEFLVSGVNNDGGLDSLKSVVSFLNKIEAVTHRLVLKINRFGEVTEVMNKNELLNNWNALKSDLSDDPLFDKMPAESQKLILKQGNMEYALNYPYHLGIKNALIYYNIIYPFYGLNFSPENKARSFGTERNSSIIKHVSIPFDNDAVYYEGDGYQEIRIQSKQKKYVDLAAMEKELKKNYPNFPGKIQSYVNTITHNYELENDSNRIINSKITLHEKIDEAFEVNIEHTLKLIQDE